MKPKTKQAKRTDESLSDTAVETLGREQHLSLIARYGLRDAIRIVRGLHDRIETTLQEQVERHPDNWPEYATKRDTTTQSTKRRSLPIPQVSG